MSECARENFRPEQTLRKYRSRSPSGEALPSVRATAGDIPSAKVPAAAFWAAGTVSVTVVPSDTSEASYG